MMPPPVVNYKILCPFPAFISLGIILTKQLTTRKERVIVITDRKTSFKCFLQQKKRKKIKCLTAQ